MIRLSKPQILLLHEQLIAKTGGSSGLRDERMLDSALNTPFQTFDGDHSSKRQPVFALVW
ncbi:MAG: cell filamentation protein Fic [Ruminococcus sp.]|jgi:death-on-curing protein